MRKLNTLSRDIFKEGFLTYLMEDCWDKKNRKVNKLSSTDLKRIATVYGTLYKNYGDLFQLLFEEDAKRITIKNMTVNTRDLRNFTILRYMKPPSYYWKPDTPRAYNNTSVCTGVPLALMGVRNVTDRKYHTWFDTILDLEDPEEVFKVDVFLGQGLTSTTIDTATGKKVWLNQDGLVKFTSYGHRLWDSIQIKQLREQAVTNHVSWNCRSVDENLHNAKFFNAASNCMKHMILQTWCWHGTNRSSDMVVDYIDWDNQIKSIDQMSSQFTGLKPKTSKLPVGLVAALGDSYEDIEELTKTGQSAAEGGNRASDDLSME